MGVLSKGLLAVGGFFFSLSGRQISEAPLLPLPIPSVRSREPLPSSAPSYLRARQRRSACHDLRTVETVRALSEMIAEVTGTLSQTIGSKIEEISSQQVVFFTRGDNIANLNEAMLYVRRNEHCVRIKIVTVVENKADVPAGLKADLEYLDRTYPEIDIEFLVIEGSFGPELVRKLSKKWKIPPNFMFIGSPGDHFLYGLAELGGVRMII